MPCASLRQLLLLLLLLLALASAASAAASPSPFPSPTPAAALSSSSSAHDDPTHDDDGGGGAHAGGGGGHDDGVSEKLHVVLLLVIGGVSLSMAVETVQHRFHITFLPGPATAVLLGLALGLAIRVGNDSGDIPAELGFSGEVFFLVLLPIIIFQAGYSLRKKEFFGQLFTILVFSVIGTAVAAFVIGLTLFGAGRAGWSLPLSLNEAMAYASILSATDAVATANMYRSLDVDPRLSVMIYGEGSVNDATSIVMYQTFASFIDEGVSDEGWAAAAEKFAEELFGSIFFGIAVGVCATFVFRFVHMGWVPACCSRTLACCPQSRTHNVAGLSRKARHGAGSDGHATRAGHKGHGGHAGRVAGGGGSSGIYAGGDLGGDEGEGRGGHSGEGADEGYFQQSAMARHATTTAAADNTTVVRKHGSDPSETSSLMAHQRAAMRKKASTAEPASAALPAPAALLPPPAVPAVLLGGAGHKTGAATLPGAVVAASGAAVVGGGSGGGEEGGGGGGGGNDDDEGEGSAFDLDEDDAHEEHLTEIAALAAASLSAARSGALGANARSSFAIFEPSDLSSIPLDMARAITKDREVKPDSSVFAQCAFILLMGYVAYMAAEALHLSGVVAVLFCGISLNHFVRPLMTSEGKDFSEGTIRVLAEIADLTTFFQVGLDAALTFGTRDGIDSQADAALLGFILLGSLLGRAVAVFGLGALINYYRREPVPFNYLVMLWHAGLRGAGAYAFTLVFPTANREVLVDATAGVVLFTVLTCGATTGRMLTWTGVPWGHNFDPAEDMLHPSAHPEKEGPIRRASFAGPEAQAGAARAAAAAAADAAKGPSFRTVLVHGAKVYLPLDGGVELQQGGAGGARRLAALTWINRMDTRVRFWVSGVVREDPS
jgi:NhaP-type Na+/H+ or K+/H+ antiporter